MGRKGYTSHRECERKRRANMTLGDKIIRRKKRRESYLKTKSARPKMKNEEKKKT